MDVVERIRSKARTGDETPKPAATEPFRIKCWGTRRREDALIYIIPNRRGGKPYEKGITENKLRKAYAALVSAGTFTRWWFNQNIEAWAKEGGCNFTTIGGLFNLVWEARYEGVDVYRKI